jgi:hypothetical protein
MRHRCLRASWSSPALLTTVVLLCSACAPAVAQLGYALYPATNPPPAPGQVAQLNAIMPVGAGAGDGASSFIKSVDGRDVSALEPPLELLPGCHLVVTDNKLVLANEAVSFSGLVGTRVFPFRMKAGHEYEIVVELTDTSGSSGRLSIYGVERTPTGATQTIPPASSPSDLQACRAWRPE